MLRSRTLLLLALAACETPPKRPVQKPADPNAVNGCQSSPGTLGAMRYHCTSYDLIDSVGKGTTRSVEADLVAAAKDKGFTSSSQVITVEGVGEALLITYQEPRGGRALDLLATVPSDSRLVQCHMRLFDNADSQPARQKGCEDAIRTLLARPAPAGVEISAVCRDAAKRLPTLSGHPEDPEDMRDAMRSFAGTCTDKIAACALAAKSFVETTLCRN